MAIILPTWESPNVGDVAPRLASHQDKARLAQTPSDRQLLNKRSLSRGAT